MAKVLGLRSLNIVSPTDVVRFVLYRSPDSSQGIELVAMYNCRFRHVLVATWIVLVPDTVRFLRPILLCIVYDSRCRLGLPCNDVDLRGM